MTVAIEDDEPPSASILEPAAGADVVAGSALRVVAGAIDDLGVERVRVYLDGQLAGEDLEAPYEFEVNLPPSGDELLLVAEAVDVLGQVGQSEVVTVEIVPDPLTSIFGRVIAEDGQAVAAAVVETIDSLSAASDPDGFFAIDGVPTIQGDLAVSVSAEIDGVVLVGESGAVTPIPAGITDLGDVALAEVSPEDCPCIEPSNWSGATAGDTWSLLSSPTDLAGFLAVPDVTASCTDNEDGTELAVESTDVELRAGVDASSAVCVAFTSILGSEETTMLEIHPIQVAACRSELLGSAQFVGLTCSP